MENVKRMKGGMLKEGARLTCQVCAKEAEYLRNVGEDLDAGKEIWVPRCESCKDVKMGTGYPDPEMPGTKHLNKHGHGGRS